MVGPQVHPPARLIHQAVKDMIARLAPPASGAWVDPDAVRLAADLPPRCPEAARDFRPSALVDAPEPQAVGTCQALLPPAAPPRVACRYLARDAAQQFPLPDVVLEPLLELKSELQVA